MVIIDVREEDEYRGGHVEGAINVPLSVLSTGRGMPEDVAMSDEIVVYCRSGNRSGMAMQLLRQLGYSRVINGLHQAHVEANHINEEEK